jgi:hypothetical protein
LVKKYYWRKKIKDQTTGCNKRPLGLDPPIYSFLVLAFDSIHVLSLHNKEFIHNLNSFVFPLFLYPLAAGLQDAVKHGCSVFVLSWSLAVVNKNNSQPHSKFVNNP